VFDRGGEVRMSFIFFLSFLYYLSPTNWQAFVSPARGDVKIFSTPTNTGI